MEEEEGRQEAPPPRGRDDAEEEQVLGDEREPGADGGDLQAVLEERDRERPPGTGNNICSVCHEPWASSGAHRICCIPCGHVYGRSCLELWLARSRSRARGTPAAAAKCLWCGQEFRREDMINLYGATEHLLQLQQQVATEEEQQQGEEEAPAHDDEAAAAMEADEAAGPGHDLQEAAADAIARMNEQAAAAAGFSWRNGAVAWKGIGFVWRIEAPPAPLVAVAGDGAAAEAAPAGAPQAGSSSVVVELGVGILVFMVAALLFLIM